MTLASSFPSPQVHAFDNPTRISHLLIKRKPNRTFHFLLIPTSSPSSLLFSCSSFPLAHSDPILQFRHHHLLSTDGNFLVEDEAAARIFLQEPPGLFLKGWLIQEELARQKEKQKAKDKYNLLRRRQVEAETEAWERMVEEYRELEREMRQKMLAPNLPHVKALLLGWFEPFRAAVEAEQAAHLSRPKKQQDSIAPHIDDLPADKVSVIVMHKMMAMVMENEEGCVQLVHAAVHIGMAVEQEVRIHKFIEGNKSSRSKKTEADAEDSLDSDKEKQRNYLNNLIKKNRLREVQMVLRKEECSPWTRDTQAKLGSRLIELLIDTAYVHSPVSQSADTPPDIRPAFRHGFKAVPWHPG